MNVSSFDSSAKSAKLRLPALLLRWVLCVFRFAFNKPSPAAGAPSASYKSDNARTGRFDFASLFCSMTLLYKLTLMGGALGSVDGDSLLAVCFLVFLSVFCKRSYSSMLQLFFASSGIAFIDGPSPFADVLTCFIASLALLSSFALGSSGFSLRVRDGFGLRSGSSIAAISDSTVFSTTTRFCMYFRNSSDMIVSTGNLNSKSSRPPFKSICQGFVVVNA